jgi:riboflavin transporter FmnP
MSNSLRLVTTAVCTALGILLPVFFHAAGIMGAIFLPMHIPVLVAGLFLGAKSGLITGVASPVLSAALTGMPPVMPHLPAMIVELAVYGTVSGYLYHQKRLSLFLSLVLAMLAGRIMAGFAVAVMAQFVRIEMTPAMYLYGYFVTGLPGMAIQLVMIPALVKKLLFAFNGNQ